MEAKTHTVTVVTAAPLSGARLAKLHAACAARYGADYTLECLVDEALIGGIRIFDNGTMIDGTVLGRLGAVRAKLLHTVQAQEDSHGS